MCNSTPRRSARGKRGRKSAELSDTEVSPAKRTKPNASSKRAKAVEIKYVIESYLILYLADKLPEYQPRGTTRRKEKQHLQNKIMHLLPLWIQKRLQLRILRAVRVKLLKMKMTSESFFIL